MPEWLIERGIGETRALRVDGDRVLAAKLSWPDEPGTGVVQAKLIRRPAGATRGLARTANGLEINVSGLPKHASEGREITVAITRAPMAEKGRLKRAQGHHFAEGSKAGPPPNHLLGKEVHRFPAGLWEDVWADAWDGEIAFAGGSLIASVTPAMTLIDIDGDLPPRDLAQAAASAVADTVRRLDIAGSIGIDFPTLPDKAQRRAVDIALGEALDDWPHERTAMNGFGFVQLVARLEGPSLLHRLHFNRTSAAARMLLRRGELAEGIGPRLLLSAHPAILDRIEPAWLAELAKRSGRRVETTRDPALALHAGQAQVLAS